MKRELSDIAAEMFRSSRSPNTNKREQTAAALRSRLRWLPWDELR